MEPPLALRDPHRSRQRIVSTEGLEAPRRLIRQDVTAGFQSGAKELDDWFQRYAWQNQKANNAVTYVTTQDDVILGYYAITTAAYSRNDAPEGLNHRSRPEEIPCILLARLAVDERAQRHGIGAALLKDAIERCYMLSREVGAAALVVHCRDEQARSFYLANGDFLPSPANNLHLLLSMKQVATLLSDS